MSRVIVIISLVSVFFFSSCLMKKIEYVKNMSPDSLYSIKASEAIKIQSKDRLSITVHSKNIELSAPFNTVVGGYNLSVESPIVNGVNADNSFEKGYLVDDNGFIDFPILGNLKVAGLSMDDIENMITKKIQDNKYISDPLVKVNLLNFKIMTMGTISNGVFNVPDGKITLLEAIVQAGGLELNSDARKVMVIREDEGKRKMLVADLEDYNMFNSEAYHLQQNDIVYVAPRYKQVNPGIQNVWSIVGMMLGAVSLVITSIALAKRY